MVGSGGLVILGVGVVSVNVFVGVGVVSVGVGVVSVGVAVVALPTESVEISRLLQPRYPSEGVPRVFAQNLGTTQDGTTIIWILQRLIVVPQRSSVIRYLSESKRRFGAETLGECVAFATSARRFIHGL